MGAFCKSQIKGHSDELKELTRHRRQVEADAIKKPRRQIDERLETGKMIMEMGICTQLNIWQRLMPYNTRGWV